MRRIGRTVFGAGANLLAQGVPFLLLLFVTPVLLHALGREAYGALILFNLVPQIAAQLDLGIITAGTRAYAQFAARGRMNDARRCIVEMLAILSVWGGLMACCFIAFRTQIAGELRLTEVVGGQMSVFVVSAIGIPLALVNGAALVPLRALEEYGRAARIQIVAGIVYWASCAWAATRGASLVELVTLSAVVGACTTVALFVSARRAARRGPVAGAPTAGADASASSTIHEDERPPGVRGGLRMRPFMRLGAGAFVAQASSLATYHTDKFLVSAMISPAAAGAYAVCSNIANKILMVVASGATYTFPRAARLHAHGDDEAVVRTFVVTTRFVLMIAVAFAIPLIALASPFLRVWIGADFAEQYATVMQLLVVGYAINASSVVASNVAIGIGEIRLPAVFAVVGGVTTIVAVVILAPRYGAPGAALAATLGMSQAMVFNGLIAARLGRSARPASWPLAARLVAVALPVGFVASAAGPWIGGWISLIAVGAASAGAFLCIWLATFGADSERRILVALLARLRPEPTA